MSYGVSRNQVKYIQWLRRRVFGGDDEGYREMLWGVARVKSCKDLKGVKIDLVITHLEKSLGIGGQGKTSVRPASSRKSVRQRSADVPPPPPGLERGEAQLGAIHPQKPTPGPQRATARQVYRIRELWAIFSTAADKEKALRSWLKGRNWPEVPEWLSFSQAVKAIEGLKQMVRRVDAARNS